MSPDYDQPRNTTIHNSSLGYRRMGERIGIALANCLTGLPMRPLTPLRAWWVSDTKSRIQFDVPVAPLTVNAEGVITTTGLGGGIGIDFSDGSGAADMATVTAWSLVAGTTDTLELTLSRPPGRATGSITLQNADAANGDTVTIAGTTFTFVTGTPANTFQVQRGGLTATRANLANAISNAFAVPAAAVVSGTSVVLTATLFGSIGNRITLAASFATPANVTLSGAALTGGNDNATSPRLYIATRATGAANGPDQGARSVIHDGQAIKSLLDNSQLFNWAAPAVLFLPMMR
jgi:hypothetical protein